MPRFASAPRSGRRFFCLPWRAFFLAVLLPLLGILPARAALTANTTSALTVLSGSVKAVAPLTPAAQLKRSRPAITRTGLTAAESAVPLEIEVAFAMRNFPELQLRLARGQRISGMEMTARYYPLADGYEKMAQWLAQRGLKVTRRDPNHLALFVRGSVAQINRVFAVTFARVAFDGQEYSSAVTAPSVPGDLAAPLLGINGLQPHLRMKPTSLRPSSTTANGPPFIPSQIAQAYGASGLPQTGANQTIAIVINTFPSTTDLSAFWSACNVTQSVGNIDFVQVVNGTLATPAGEETLDVEWTSSIAPAARIRVYGSLDLSNGNLDACYQQILTDLPTQPNLHQVSLSYGGPEFEFPPAQLQTDAQYFAAMAAAGVTVFVSSGDGGSRPNPANGSYSSTAAISVEYPSSDPSVVGVGGTSLSVDSFGHTTGETSWSGSGGGVSGFFKRPTWQSGASVPAGLMRLVPDISADADPITGAYVFLNGSPVQFGGTSLATPICAGFCALINQARADAGLPPLGYLNPRLYPLLGSANFRDITSGSNGDYSAAPGYDLVTGLGTPLVSNLINPLVNAPTIVSPLADQEVLFNTNATFSINATGPGPLSYQWQRIPLGASAWSNLTDNATYSGSATPTLSITNATVATSGDQFQCLVTNSFGSTPSFPSATLIVNVPLLISTLAGQSGIQGGNNGLGTAAQFTLPIGVAVSTNGTVFVADTYGQLIRKITPSGNVTTLAGKAGVTGSANGAGLSTASFNYPAGIAVDSSGNAYVTDNNNQLIRKITPAGNVSTLAGRTGVSGSSNGSFSAARFFDPIGIASLGNGTIFVADTDNHLARKITNLGIVSTLAGLAGSAGSFDGNASTAQFDQPWGIAVAANGTVFVADTFNHVIRKVTPTGNVSTYAGQSGISGYADGLASNAEFSYPVGVAIDALGNVYVSDNNNSVIRAISPSGVVSTVAGTSGNLGDANGIGPAAQFNYPFSLTVDGSGTVYIADANNDLIRKGVLVSIPAIVTSPANVTTVAGQNATFTVTASGTPSPTYQWQLSTDSGATWSPLSDNATFNGSATASLTINATAFAMNGWQFQCIAANLYGSAITAAATLVVNVPPAFTTQPQSTSVTEGTVATFTAAASGFPANITYQWQLSTNGGGSWSSLTDNANFSGTATGTLAVNTTTVDQSNWQFQCLAANGINPSAVSSSATLTVTAPTFAQSVAALGLSGNSALATATPFADGLPNLARYAMNLGANPAANQLPQTVLDTSGATPALTLQYRLLKGLTGLTVTVQSSTDLLTWTNISNADLTQLTDADPQTARYLATVPLAPSTPLFLRLVFTQSP